MTNITVDDLVFRLREQRKKVVGKKKDVPFISRPSFHEIERIRLFGNIKAPFQYVFDYKELNKDNIYLNIWDCITAIDNPDVGQIIRENVDKRLMEKHNDIVQFNADQDGFIVFL